MSDDLSALFKKQLDKVTPDKKKPKKKTPLAKKKLKTEIAILDQEKLDEAMNDPYDEQDFGELIGDAQRAKLEKSISDSDISKYKAQQEKLKLMKQSGEVMEFDKGDMLFFGFIEKGSIESLRVTKKLQAKIKNLCDENDPKGIMNIIDRELENVFVNIQEEQMETVENWRKNLK